MSDRIHGSNSKIISKRQMLNRYLRFSIPLRMNTSKLEDVYQLLGLSLEKSSPIRLYKALRSFPHRNTIFLWLKIAKFAELRIGPKKISAVSIYFNASKINEYILVKKKLYRLVVPRHEQTGRNRKIWSIPLFCQYPTLSTHFLR